ncbi:putative metal-binding motif-containing protein [Solirubrobacter phytolaccae]|uniref:Metal-binding motif-containing protein n=1 Tax=Solirubrobacter phytolaccae TaxID=1404360 RepID=A0A9X3S994_9ACTN|nr:putative metal-binding motif-containing protein [Solirubrobacter phytolaccae]MDA0179015.1 putative metal-binding motif-containing protein [Solirubrobacter phytolaccae]
MSTVRATLLLFALFLVAPSAAQAADIFAIGSQARLTHVGPDGTTTVGARNPSVAYNSANDEYLVVWVGNTATGVEDEILGQILDGSGTPKGAIQKLSDVPDSEPAPAQPIAGYSPVVNQYVVAYIATPKVIPGSPDNSPPLQREVIAQSVTATGVRSGNPARISDTDRNNADADQASDPAMAYDPEHDQYRFLWLSDATTEGDFEVSTQRASSGLINPDGFAESKVSTTVAGSADAPAIAYMPAQDRWAATWEGAVAGGTEIVAAILTISGGAVVAPAQISSGGGLATMPAIAVNTARNEVLISFVRNNLGTDGAEAFVQRVSSTGAQLPNATDQRISSMGPENNVAYDVSTSSPTTASYHPALDRYLVTWASENDLPGMVDGEIERYGQAIDGAGTEVETQDFRLTVSGNDGTTTSVPTGGATTAIPGKRAWLHVWSADDNRPPLADGEFELYGRFVGDDGDLDGHVVPADCNDGNAAIHPGVADMLDNGVDEDCSGADAQSPPPVVVPAGVDGDGDGFFAGQDCNDASRAIRPGAVEVKGNRVDENCDGVVEPFPTLTAGVVHNWGFKRNGSAFTLRVLQVTQQFPKGWKAEIKCSGKKCPFKAKTLKAAKVKRNASSVIGSLSSKQRKFRAGQTVEVWVSAPGFNTKVARIPLKKGKQPVIQALCVVPGQTKPQKSCT